jgi:putative effector of murein hydrolase LrgA (UPF0299 family)
LVDFFFLLIAQIIFLYWLRKSHMKMFLHLLLLFVPKIV